MSSEDVDVGDAALQELLNEAENLMHDLETDRPTGGVIEGFSIDSDDEEDDDGATPKVVDDHPLSLENLSINQTPVPPTPAPSNGNAHASMSSSLPSLFSNGMASASGGQATMGMNATGGAAATGATMDSLKEQTTRFATGLASMAQRAAQQVAVATAPVNPVQVTGGPPGATVPAAPKSFPIYPASKMGTPPPTARATSSTSTPQHAVELDKEQKIRLIREHVGQLLPGERIIMFLSNLLHVSDTSGVTYVASQSPDSYMWCCAMSFYRLILFSTADEDTSKAMQVRRPPGWDASCWPGSPSATKILEIPLSSMQRVEKTVYQAAGSSYMGLVIFAKDCGRVLRFTTPSYADTGRAYDALNNYAFPGRSQLGYLFAFESKREDVMASVQADSITLPPVPKRFDATVEFPRLINKTSLTNAPWIMWGSINSTYKLSPTYPSVLVGPATLDETKPETQHIIRQCANFRSEQRLPSMTWCTVGGASIWRASQPKVGLQGNRSPADELFIRHIIESARGANAMAEPAPIYPRSLLQQLTGDYSKDWVPEPGCGLKILDLRPRSAAMANRTGGYGYENTSHYQNTTLQFCNIVNIHGVRDSYQKLCTVCNSDATADVNWHSLVEDTKWMAHIRLILAASWETAYWVHLWRMPVLLHCSHGWDRTSQVAAIAQLLLDPYYRTCHGFSVLVEKDFMSFGHPFHTRCAHGVGRSQAQTPQSSNQTDEGQIAPIFHQFLDCVYQILQLYPDSFEFNERYLLKLSFHVFSCRFGNMLCDTEKEREMLAGIRQRTYSVWDYLDSLPELKNDNFSGNVQEGSESSGVLLMPLPTLLRNVRLWSKRHCSYSLKPTLREPSCDHSELLSSTDVPPADMVNGLGTSA